MIRETPTQKAQRMGESFLHDMQGGNGKHFLRFFENEIALLLPEDQRRAQTFWKRLQSNRSPQLEHDPDLAADMAAMNEHREQFVQILKNVYRARYDGQIHVLEHQGLGAEGFTAAFDTGAERYHYTLSGGEDK